MRYPKATKEELTAPTAKFRVLGVDVRGESEAVYVIGDFDSLTAAKEAAKQNPGISSPAFIYNDQAELIALRWLALALVVRRAGGRAIAQTQSTQWRFRRSR